MKVTTPTRALSVVQGFVGATGRTPLVRLNRLSQQTGCEILAKAEFMNPGGSVKDRAAVGLISDAERKGFIKQGGTIVEGTAGNTGIGLAHVCRSRGYKCVIYMPNTQSQEKIDLLRMLGAEVYPVPAVAYENPENYNHQAKRHAEQLENAFWTDQFDNPSNARYHESTTGPEILKALSSIAESSPSSLGFICSTGTGGTLAGVTLALKAGSKEIQCYLADPPGSVLAGYFQSGKKNLGERIGSSITEGIGQGRVTSNLALAVDSIDGAFSIPDEETFEMIYRLLDEEGIYVGASSALNVVSAVKLAQKMGRGSTVVTILADGAYRYQSRLFSKNWVESKKLWGAIPTHLQKYAILP